MKELATMTAGHDPGSCASVRGGLTVLHRPQHRRCRLPLLAPSIPARGCHALQACTDPPPDVIESYDVCNIRAGFEFHHGCTDGISWNGRVQGGKMEILPDKRRTRNAIRLEVCIHCNRRYTMFIVYFQIQGRVYNWLDRGKLYRVGQWSWS